MNCHLFDKLRNGARSPAHVSCSSTEIHGAVPGCTSWESGNSRSKLNKLMHLTAAVKRSWTSAALPSEELLPPALHNSLLLHPGYPALLCTRLKYSWWGILEESWSLKHT